jgi:hypothetical protein
MKTSDEKTYTVAATFTVDARTDAHLRTRRAIRDEFHSWLEGLNATVRNIHVTTKREERDK